MRRAKHPGQEIEAVHLFRAEKWRSPLEPCANGGKIKHTQLVSTMSRKGGIETKMLYIYDGNEGRCSGMIIYGEWYGLLFCN